MTKEFTHFAPFWTGNEEDLKWARETFGNKSINEIRREAGMQDVNGGEISYCEFLRRVSGLPVSLRLVKPNDIHP